MYTNNYTGLDYTQKTLLYFALLDWYNNGFGKVFNILSTTSEWRHPQSVQLLHLQDCQEV